MDRRQFHAAFTELLTKMSDTVRAKNDDYSGPEDPLANLRSAEGFGVPAWVGAAIRMNDKMTRLMSFARTGSLNYEGVEDTLLDLAVYALLTHILYSSRTRNHDHDIPERSES